MALQFSRRIGSVQHLKKNKNNIVLGETSNRFCVVEINFDSDNIELNQPRQPGPTKTVAAWQLLKENHSTQCNGDSFGATTFSLNDA